MSQPFIFITSHTLREDRLDDFPEMNRRFLDFVEAYEPRPIGLHVYANEEGTQVSLVQVHPDADSMEFHLHVVGALLREALELVSTDRVQVYGNPGDRARKVLEQIAAAGVPVSIAERPLAGFSRAVA
jgi:hypothetical protein